jgi:ribosomal protein S18 acetylase RimI-like enzyme
MAWAGPVPPKKPLTELALRPATEADYPELAAQNALYFGGDVDEHLSNLRVSATLTDTWRQPYLALWRGEVIGKIELQGEGDAAWIYGLGIKPPYRGQGHGRTLLRHGLAALRAREPRRILLEVEVENERALSLYTGAGFKSEVIYDYYALKI